MQTIKLLALATVAASVMTSAAYAGSNQVKQRIARENYEYFQGRETHGTTAAGANKADYQFNSRPEQRLAARNKAYFDQVGYGKSSESKPFNRYTDVSEYPFSGSVLSAERGGYVWSSAQAH